MSVEKLHSFLNKAKGDEGLKAKLKEVGSPADVVAVGKASGYDFSEADIAAANKQKMNSGEVSQEDLDKVSGGTITPTLTIIIMTIATCGR